LALARYALWAARQAPIAERSCPSCGSTETKILRRKFVVTALAECARCSLRFRLPKQDPEAAQRFYEHDYDEWFTTRLPTAQELSELLSSHFRGTRKDLSVRLQVLRACRLEPGARVYDFGSSWGYGSWQLRGAGYEVFSYEVAPTRARYASEKLGCNMMEDPRKLPAAADCLLGVHVIEHLPDPGMLWGVADATVKPGGLVVLFMPNGEHRREQADPRAYHAQWGLVHPLLFTAASLEHSARRSGFSGRAYSSPYDLTGIEAGLPGDLSGAELCFIARREVASAVSMPSRS
jgi:hypothetical protein